MELNPRSFTDTDIANLESVVNDMIYGDMSNSFESLSNAMEVCAKHIWLIPELARLGFSKYVDNNVPMLRNFYNESIDFIDGKDRDIRVETWDGIIRDIVNHGTSESSTVGSIGTLAIVKPASRKKMLSLRKDGEDLKLNILSYAHRDIVSKWIVRKNGVYDMTRTILLFALVHKRYYESCGSDTAA